MIRFLLYAIATLFLLRIFFRIARALSRSGADSRSAPRDPGDPRAGAGVGDRATRGRVRVKGATEQDRSSAIEVPFTEIPPEEPARRP